VNRFGVYEPAASFAATSTGSHFHMRNVLNEYIGKTQLVFPQRISLPESVVFY
jgi:hypothetical protein